MTPDNFEAIFFMQRYGKKGQCRGNVAVQTWDQLGIGVAMRTFINFNVYCECF